MARRADRTGDLLKVFRRRGDSGWLHALDGDEARWGGRSAKGAWRDETPRTSLATRLERSHSFTGRVARRLFLEGRMGVFLIGGLIVLGLVMGLLGR